MLRLRSFVVALLIVAAASSACANDAWTVTTSGDRDGLTFEVRLRPTGHSLRAETIVRNTRDAAVHLDTTQCGRAAQVFLARTTFEPEGDAYTGSLDAVKELLLKQQRSNQFDDSFAPRRDSGSSEVPDCVRPTQPITLPPDGSITESWELPFETAYALAEVGSEHMSVRAATVESVAPDKLGFIDLFAPGQADPGRLGRDVTVETPAAGLFDRPPTRPNTGPSLGQRFDRMIGTAAIRTFLEAQPADSWRQATIISTLAGPWEFRAVTTGFERGLRVDLTPDGTVMGTADIPGANDRSRVFERRPATTPPGVAYIPEPEMPVLTEDVIAGTLSLPSGRVVADGAMIGQTEPFPDVAAPGDYPIFVTVGRLPNTAYVQVAFASLVVSDAPTVSWLERPPIAVDGGTAGFTSAEGSAFLANLGEQGNLDAVDTAFDSLTAHDDTVTVVPIGDGLDMALFTTGYGDGGYPVHIGLDADGKPTRFVIDFAIVHLAWP